MSIDTTPRSIPIPRLKVPSQYWHRFMDPDMDSPGEDSPEYANALLRAIRYLVASRDGIDSSQPNAPDHIANLDNIIRDLQQSMGSFGGISVSRPSRGSTEIGDIASP